MILPATHYALEHVFANLRAADSDELVLARGMTTEDAGRLADEVVSTPGCACVCLAADGVPVAAAGIQSRAPGFGVAWAVGTDRARRYFREVHAAIRPAIEDAIGRGTIVHAFSWADHPDGNRWLRALRFTEAARVAGPSGAPFIVFERRAT